MPVDHARNQVAGSMVSEGYKSSSKLQARCFSRLRARVLNFASERIIYFRPWTRSCVLSRKIEFRDNFEPEYRIINRRKSGSRNDYN